MLGRYASGADVRRVRRAAGIGARAGAGRSRSGGRRRVLVDRPPHRLAPAVEGPARAHPEIVALPRENRWQTRARAALRDDLYAQERTLTAKVLQTTSPQSAPAERIDRWLVDNGHALLRTAQVIADIKAGSAIDLAVLSVALRENNALISQL